MSKWIIKEINLKEVEEITISLEINNILSKIFVARKILSHKQIKQFLNSSLMDLSSPKLMTGMSESCERIKNAINNKENILIFGDFDVDGTSACSILLRFFKHCSMEVDYFIPDRKIDGYGITLESAEKILLFNPNLIITVDCGISANKSVDFLRAKGIDIIITDHHLPSEKLPDTPYLINPKLDLGTTFQDLCGAGIAFKLAWGIAQALSDSEKVNPSFRKLLMELIPLASVATIADIAPMHGENRTIVTEGLKILSKGCAIFGLNALLDIIFYKRPIKITTFDVGFKIAPRMNAAGRMKHASTCVKLMTANTKKEAIYFAKELEKNNKERQKICEETIQSAILKIESDIDIKNSSVIILADESWHKGVLGIVASKITEKYFKPAIILSKDGEFWNGSSRSYNDIHLKESLDKCSDLLVRYGGHKGAAGLTVNEDKLREFADKFSKIISGNYSAATSQQIFYIDTKIEHSDLKNSLADIISKLEPFGDKNPQPLLLVEKMELANLRTVGNNNSHLKMELYTNTGNLINGIAFGMGEHIKHLHEGNFLDIIFYPVLNEWMGNVTLDLQIKDFKESTI